MTFLLSLMIQWGGMIRLACWPSVHSSSMLSFVKQPSFVWYAVLHQEQLMATISYTVITKSTSHIICTGKWSHRR